MAPKKRKTDASDEPTAPLAKKGTRIKQNVEKTASSSRPKRTSLTTANAPRSTRSSMSGSGSGTPAKTSKKATTISVKATTQNNSKTNSNQGRKRGRKASNTPAMSTQPDVDQHASFSVDVPAKHTNGATEAHNEEEHADEPSYWLMKAEPDSRIEKGRDVKFSIDDLKATTAPEPWDGTFLFLKTFRAVH